MPFILVLAMPSTLPALMVVITQSILRNLKGAVLIHATDATQRNSITGKHPGFFKQRT
jgi:hypothetical protein